MSNPTTLFKRKSTISLGLILLIGLIIRVSIILQPAEEILARYGSDDMYYYTEVASSLAHKGILSFDGERVTTGVQPLFMLMLVPLSYIYDGSPQLALKLTLVLITLLSIASTILLYLFIKRVFKHKYSGVLAIISATIWFLYPKLISISFQGTEAALTGFVWIAILFCWHKFINKERAWLFGLIIGIGILTRIDIAILAALLFIIAIVRHKVPFKRLAISGFIALVVVAPWFITCYILTGNAMPNSGKAKRIHSERIFALENNIPFDEVNMFSNIAARNKELSQKFIIYTAKVFHAESKVSFYVVFLLAILIGVFIFYWFKRKVEFGNSIIKQVIDFCMPFVAASVLIIIAYLFYLHDLREWYLVPLFLFFILGLSTLLVEVFPKPNNLWKYFIVGFAMLFCAKLLWDADRNRRHHYSDTFLEAIEEVNNMNTPLKVGAFNSGILGAYSSDNVQVINLDGIVNQEALVSIENYDLYDYIKSEEIDYIVDHSGSVQFFSKVAGEKLMPNLSLVDSFAFEKNKNAFVGLWQVN